MTTRIPLYFGGFGRCACDNGGTQNEPPAAYLAVRELRALDGYKGAAR
jgi:hypothetical protein